ncbi:MAG: SUF system NifU family Fe-S cluster assembly protein [Chthonomonadales bacterium]|nr:SUF system NifU family Fe-S cluster assembly protein [Chthonomonadales bacterium]
MSDLRELYQEVILDHNRHPRNFRAPEGANVEAVGHNPLCGDQLTVFLRLQGGRVAEAGFQGSGCAISKASASMMTDAVKGKTVEEIRRLFEGFHDMVTGKLGDVDPDEMGKLLAFAGVSEFPARVKCASLAWHTLQAALASSGTVVTTE